jgi:hypothetical protein
VTQGVIGGISIIVSREKGSSMDAKELDIAGVMKMMEG